MCSSLKIYYIELNSVRSNARVGGSAIPGPTSGLDRKEVVCVAYALTFSLQHMQNSHMKVSNIIHYQLMKELFPAEWFPISITVIFFLGGSSVTPTDWAIDINPG